MGLDSPSRVGHHSYAAGDDSDYRDAFDWSYDGLDMMIGFSALIVSGIAMVIFTIPLGIVLEIDGMLALIHRLGTWSIQRGTFGWIQGTPVPVIKNGVIHVHGLKKAHLSKEELFMQLRNLEIPRVDDVELATLEPDGRLGIILKEEATPLNPMLAKKTIYDDLFDVLQVPQESNPDQEYHEIVKQCPDSMGKNHCQKEVDYAKLQL